MQTAWNFATEQSWDIVIAGGGLAGLSLAAELSAPEFAHLRVLVIEPRTSYLRDRTWSYWNVSGALPQRWQGLAKTLWRKWRVSDASKNLLCESKTTYAMLPADAFYEQALAQIKQASHIQFKQGYSLHNFRSAAQGLMLELLGGESLRCGCLIDTRPPTVQSPQEWVQHFVGWEVQTREACFEPECMDLMAFDQQTKGLHFVYCLPYSPHSALVETTWISRAQHRPDYEAEIKQALLSRFKCEHYEITFCEQGALPLWPAQTSPQPNVIKLGRAGGALRASTGYAFTATLWQAQYVAKSLQHHLSQSISLQNWIPVLPTISRLDDWMDRVLFLVLENDWPAAPGYFLAMFEHVAPDAMVRFLSGRSTWVERLAVMNSLPKLPFLKAAFGGEKLE